MLTFLLFTDDPALRYAVETLVSGRGISLAVTPSYREAMALVEQKCIALAAADVSRFPGKGRTLLEYIAEQSPDIRRLALSPTPLNDAELSPGVDATRVGEPYGATVFRQAMDSEINCISGGGTMSNVSPHLFAQLLEMEGRTCILRVFDSRTTNGGMLAFRNGKLVAARFQTLAPMDAACRILAWETADIFIQNAEFSGEDRIREDLQSIIMKSAHLKDEAQDAAPPPEPRAAAHPAAPEKQQSFAGRLKQHLDADPGNLQGIADIFHNPGDDGLIRASQTMGDVFGFGRLKLGYADDGSAAKVFIPGSPSTTLTLNAQCPRDGIIRSIYRYLD
ncbi:MAG: DUF4388 domain-containing protein [Desulfobacter sp.]